jgi:hypothetical protein
MAETGFVATSGLGQSGLTKLDNHADRLAPKPPVDGNGDGNGDGNAAELWRTSMNSNER